MTDKTPEPKLETPASGTASPETTGTGFARRQVQWGRPPSQVFHAGPLPRGPLAPLPPMPRMLGQTREEPSSAPVSTGPATTMAPATPRPFPVKQAQSPMTPARPGAPTGGGFYNHSMIPKARSGAVPPVAPLATPSVAEPAAMPPVEATEVPTSAPVWPDATVRPLPEAAPVAARPIDSLTGQPPETLPEPVVASSPNLDFDRPAAAAPEKAPVVPAYARSRHKTGATRTPLYIGAGVVLIAVIGAGAWFLRPQPTVAPNPAEATVPVSTQPLLPAVPPPVVEPDSIPVPAASSTSDAPVVAPAASPAPVRPPTARPTTVQPATTPATRPVTRPTVQPQPAPARPAPTAIQTAPTRAPQIVVAPIVAPPASPPPTAARSQSTDPNAPISTRPQPLD